MSVFSDHFCAFLFFLTQVHFFVFTEVHTLGQVHYQNTVSSALT